MGDKEQRVELTRHFDAPRERMWQAWTDPELIRHWWGPDNVTVPLASIEVDPRVGGAFRLTMVVRESNAEVVMDSRFTEVVDRELLRFTEPTPCLPQMRSVDGLITFADRAGGTEVAIDIVMVTSADIREESVAGWGESLDRLAEVL